MNIHSTNTASVTMEQLYARALALVEVTGNVSCSSLQRHLRICYTVARELHLRLLNDPVMPTLDATISRLHQVRLNEPTEAILSRLPSLLDTPGCIGIDATDLSDVLVGARCPDQVAIHSASSEARGTDRAAKALARALTRFPSAESLTRAHGSATVVTATSHSLTVKELKMITHQIRRQLPIRCNHLIGVGLDPALPPQAIHVSVIIGSSLVDIIDKPIS